jgi:hypothetical protein
MTPQERVAYCFGYIIGAAVGLFSGARLALMSAGTTFEEGTSPASALGVCVSNGVTKRQIIEIVVAYLADHPENRHEPAPTLVHSAMTEAFPY